MAQRRFSDSKFAGGEPGQHQALASTAMPECPSVCNCWGQPLDSFPPCPLAQKKAPKPSLETVHHATPENLELFYTITQPRAVCPGFYQCLLRQYLDFCCICHLVHPARVEKHNPGMRLTCSGHWDHTCGVWCLQLAPGIFPGV